MTSPGQISWWGLELPSLALFAGWTALYLRGASLRRASTVRHRRRTMSFLAGVATALVSVVGPIPSFGEHLLWVHMLQHLLMTVVAAPLLAYGAPIVTARLALGPGPRHTLARLSRSTRRARRRIGNPPAVVLATIAHILTLWVWHIPAVYDAAVRLPALHLLEHGAFMVTAVWFWSEIRATAARAPRRQATATLCLGAMIMTGGLLGALMTFAGQPLYAEYTGLGSLSALDDQEFAGALMWVPPAFVYAAVAVRRFAGWIHATEADLQRREQQQLARG